MRRVGKKTKAKCPDCGRKLAAYELVDDDGNGAGIREECPRCRTAYAREYVIGRGLVRVRIR